MFLFYNLQLIAYHGMNTAGLQLVKSSAGSYVLISRDPPEFISYEPTNSFFLGYGIEGSNMTAEQDAKVMAECVSRTVLPRSNVSMKMSSSNPMACAGSQIAKEFKTHASQVGRDGLFVFYYAGPGVQVSPDCWSIVPSNFDRSDPTTFITAQTINSWLRDVHSEAKEVLMIFACPFADKITSAFDKGPQSGLNMSSIALPSPVDQMATLSPLKCSTSNYFLCQAMTTSFLSSGILQLKRIYDKTVTCCRAFSDLIVTYDPVLKCLNRHSSSEPTLASTRKPQPVTCALDREETDAVPGNLAFLAKHFTRGGRGHSRLHHYVDVWLQSAENLDSGPLAVLRSMNTLNEELVNAVVCVLMCSLASIQVAFEPGSAGSANLLIIAFMTVSATVTSVYPDVSLGVDHFKLSCQFYYRILSACGIETSSVRMLYDRVCQETV